MDKSGPLGFDIVRNDDWIRKLNCIEYLRDVGKHFSVNMMLGKESVRQRIENREQGISYTEFSYMLLQAYDFYWLYKNHGCRLQIGGSDQWGNITAGVELIRRKNPPGSEAAHGFTYPLITTKSGVKFGKTEAGAVWLDAKRTSPYAFYQFWVNTADADIEQYFYTFTDQPKEAVVDLLEKSKSNPDERAAQRSLSYELTSLVHGKSEADKAVNASKALFSEEIAALDKKTLLEIFQDVPSTELSRSEFEKGITIQDLLIKTQLAKSKGEAKRQIDGGGIYMNNARVTESQTPVAQTHLIDGSLLVIRSGKKNYHLVQLKS